MIDLTLNSLWIPNIDGYTPPFGTKVNTTHANKGGLSTRETNNNIISAFAKMRPILISFSEITSEVEFDARLMINATDEITLALGNGTYAGCVVSIINDTAFSHTLSCTSVSETTDIIEAHNQLELIWNGTKWQNLLAPAVGKQVPQYPTEKAPSVLYPCTKWEEVNYNGAFFRSAGGSAEGYISDPLATLTPQSQQTRGNQLSFVSGRTSSSDPKLYTDTEPSTNRPRFNGGKPTHWHITKARVNWDGGSIGSHEDCPIAYQTYAGYSTEELSSPISMECQFNSATMNFSGSTSGSHKHTYTPFGTIVSDDIETRPINYTMKIWKRIA